VKLPKINPAALFATAKRDLAEARKALVPILAAVAELVALGLLHGAALDAATAVLGVAASLGVYVTPNAKPPALVAEVKADVKTAESTVADVVKDAKTVEAIVKPAKP
jgi:hypothetical protein